MGLFYCTNFNIRLLEKQAGDDLFSTAGKEIYRLLSDTGLFKREPVSVLADPFLFTRDGFLFLFYERQVRHYGKGKLWMRKTDDLVHWSEETEVLDKPYHLSFPFVFEADGQVWMIPETGYNFNIQLYRAEDETLTRWKQEKILVDDGVKWRDASVIRKDGVWYLFATICDENPTALHLFTSDRLDGTYTEHPCSPVCRGKEFGRNGGSVFEYAGGLYRPAQNCLRGYGKQLSIVRIDRMTPTDYAETVVKRDLIDTSDPFYRYGGHQFNFTTFQGRTLVSTDARCRNYNLIELFRRLSGRK